MAGLCELRVTQASDDGAQVRFDVALIELAQHPPRFEVVDGTVTGSTFETVIDTAHVIVPSAELDAWAVSGPPPDVIALTASPLWSELLRRSTAPAPWGLLPATVGRITITTTPERVVLPWADLIDSTNASQLALVSRAWSAPGRSDRYLDGHLRFAITGAQTDVHADELFDGFVMDVAQQYDALRWDAEPSSSDLWHLAATDPAEAVGLLTGVRCPRVVVAQLTEARADDPALRALVDDAMTQGAWAVVITEFPQSRTSDFFQPLYRKLFHNWPLEYCVRIGLDVAQVPASSARLFARPGGELALSLWRVGPEQAVAPVAAMVGWDPGADPDVRPRLGTPGGMLEHIREGGGAAVREPERRGRVVSALQRDIAASAADLRAERAAAPIDRSMRLQFEEESTDFGQLLAEADEIATVAAPETDEVAMLATEASAAPPGLRHTTVSFLDGERQLRRDEPLRPQTTHRLRVAIEPTTDGPHISVPFDEAPLAEDFRRRSVVDLDVVVFSPPTEFTIPTNIATLRLPRVGPSTPVTFDVTPRHDGWCALRVAIYHRNTMLQSVAVRAFTWASDTPDDAVPTIRRDLDWAASTDLQLLDELAAPAINIFSNDGPEGSHWIGVFSQDGDEMLPLRRGQMRSFDSTDLSKKADLLRGLLQATHGTDTYRYPSAPPDDPTVVDFGREAIVELATAGWEFYSYLFRSVSDDEFSKERKAAFRDALQQEAGIISVARCDGKWSLPWAAMYDKRIDTGRLAELHVCEVFEAQLGANTWSDDDTLGHRADLLDDPAACHAQDTCPLHDDDKEKVTVCPFGFWGIRHQIEQPLQQVRAVADDAVPDRLSSDAFNQTSIIRRGAAERVRIGAGAFPFPGVDRHEADVRTIDADVEWRMDRSDVMALLGAVRGHHLVYFYCHGIETHKYALRFGPKGDDLQNTIAYDNIFEEDIHWGKDGAPQPLVLIIACESSAASPDVADAMFDQLRNVGATGVVGSEISIGIRLGRETGRMLVTSVVDGASVGEAFLAMRRDLLRRHNPLGLVFTPNAPATLHLCDDPTGAGACARHHRRRSAPT